MLVPFSGDKVSIAYGYGPLGRAVSTAGRRARCHQCRVLWSAGGRGRRGAALDESDLFVLPCVIDENGDMDGLPTVIGEAMAAGVPVITTDVSSIPEIVRDGLTGFVVAPRDTEALARRIAEVVAMDRGALRRVIPRRATWSHVCGTRARSWRSCSTRGSGHR